MKEQKMVSVAQGGVGYWGPNLLRNLVAHKKCRVAMVADLAEERRDYVKANYPSVAVTGSVQEVMQDPSVQAVILATPVATHFDLAMQALRAGKHILVEKPMAATVQEVEQIGALAKQRGLEAMG